MNTVTDTPVATSPLSLLRAAIEALRPKQWTKNTLLFAALFFSLSFKDGHQWGKALMGFAAFCMLSSSGYIFNDARDRFADVHHPKKKKRPIASGRLPVTLAYVEIGVIFAIGCALAWLTNPWFLAVALLYFATTISYSLYFKHFVILDVMFLASGFIWRAAAGAVAIDVVISPWLLTCTAFFALFLGFNKRRGELTLMEGQSAESRKALKQYTQALVIEFQAITTSSAIISYALYTVLASPTPWLIVTLPHVLYAVFRYIYLVSVEGDGGAPDETLLRDRPMLLTCLLYGVTVIVVLLVAPLRPH